MNIALVVGDPRCKIRNGILPVDLDSGAVVQNCTKVETVVKAPSSLNAVATLTLVRVQMLTYEALCDRLSKKRMGAYSEEKEKEKEK